MTDKLSRETEDDVLGTVDEQDQTVGSFDDDASVQTGAGGVAEKKKNSSKGGLIMIGVAAVVAIGLAVAYFTFVKKDAPAKAKTVKPKEKKEEPKKEVPTKEVTPTTENGFPSDTGSKESKTAAEFLNRDTPPIAVLNEVASEVTSGVVKASPIEQPPVAILPVAPIVPVSPVVEPSAVVVPQPVVDPLSAVVPTQATLPVVESVPAVVPVVNKVEAPAQVQDTSINSAFDSIATRVDSVSTRVDGLEKFKSAQEDLNNQFEKRIVRLEGFHDGDNGKSSTGTVAPKVVKPKVVAKPRVNHNVSRVVKPKRTDISGDILVDKSDVALNTQANKPNPLEKYQFHSIYDNRVWLKNPDGSLSTFTVGSKLPSGEVIKAVNHDQFEVVTNKRTIRKD